MFCLPLFKRTRLGPAALAVAVALCSPLVLAQEKVLRIAITTGDIPRTLGQPDQGFEGTRFTGIPMYDALTQWDLTSETQASGIIPGLAESWEVDGDDQTRWVFNLRRGAKFHDGSEVNADAIVWNIDKVLNKSAPQFDASQVGITTIRTPTLVSARKIDDYTVELTTSEPDSFLPINLTNLFIASPTHWQAKFDAVPASVSDAAVRSQQAWAAFASDPSGSGPFRSVRLVPRERLEMAANPEYWDETRRPAIDRVVLLPMPEASARTAALMSGQVDWIEAPAPDALDAIRARGFQVYSNPQPHIWPWQVSVVDGSPFTDIRVRQAANLCVDRASLKQLLGGMMDEATGVVGRDHPWYGNPGFEVRYDTDAGRALMEQAGYSQSQRLRAKVQISSSGSGQMQPLPMNEFIQQSLRDCFFDVEFDVQDMNTLLNNWRLGARDPSSNGAHATNISISTMDPFTALVRFVSTKAFPPVSNNWGYFSSPKLEELAAVARTTFDDDARDQALARLHEHMVDEAVFVFIAHDVGPRAMSQRVKGVVQPKSWFIDIATMDMD